MRENILILMEFNVIIQDIIVLIPEVINELKKYNLEINTWTVNEKEAMRYLCSKGVDIIITNYPELAKEINKYEEER